MVTSNQCLAKYGTPEEEKAMVLWDVPPALEIGVLPKRLYCNRDMVWPLTRAFGNLIERGVVSEIKTWDGCFNIRNKKLGKTPSLHSWGVAIDINATWNRMGTPGTMSKELIACFTDAGFEWGGAWKGKFRDPMHFQLAKI